MFMPSFFVISMSQRSASSVGGRVQPVRPEPLVERPDLEDELVVELEPQDALSVFGHVDLPHGEIAVDPVGHRITLLERNGEIVEVRLVGRPELELASRQRELEFKTHAACGAADLGLAAARDDLDSLIRRGSDAFDGQNAGTSRRRRAVSTHRSILALGTGSSQTVCQMPVVGVYIMPPGLSTCLPRG